MKDKAVGADAMYVILGASGYTGSIIANSLLSKGRKVRISGRRGAIAILCAQRRGSIHGQRQRCGCAPPSLQWCARGLRGVAAHNLS